MIRFAAAGLDDPVPLVLVDDAPCTRRQVTPVARVDHDEAQRPELTNEVEVIVIGARGELLRTPCPIPQDVLAVGGVAETIEDALLADDVRAQVPEVLVQPV